MEKDKSLRFETLCIHTGLKLGNESKSIVPPISPSTIYEVEADGRSDHDFMYSRLGNPNRLQLETLLAVLERGEICATFSSGLAATTAVLQALNPGDHVLVPDDIYAGNRKLMDGLMKRWGLQIEFIRMTEPEHVEAHIRENTKLVWIETPSNPMLRITDIQAVSSIAKKHGAITAVDNTWPTPVNQLPLELGADIVVHSTTKYFGGHSDVMGGAVIAKKNNDYFERVRFIQKMGGAVPSPHDCWMLSRSTRTLAYRMRGHNEHASIIAKYLSKHPKIQDVFYPELEHHPGHEIAKKQMSGFGGMISFLVDGNAEDAIKVVGKSQLIKRATSLGGVESTWEHRLSTEGEGSETPGNLIRLSVGLEHPDDLLADIEQAIG